MEEISSGIYYENSFSGVTLGAILLPQGTILLDAPLRAEEGRIWRTTLNNLGASPNRVLVNLDAHPDRTLGARGMDCTIIAHQKTAQVFRSRPSVFKGQNSESGSEWEAYDEAVGTRWAVPDLTFTEHLLIHWGPYPVIMEQHPGPMPGAIWVILPEDKIIFVGDTVLANQPPFLAHADIEEWLASLDYLHKNFKNFMIVSGRGGLLPPESIREQQNLLKRIQRGIEKFSSLSDLSVAAEKMIPLILNELEYPEIMEDQYIQRLRHGLAQYNLHHYGANDILVSDP